MTGPTKPPKPLKVKTCAGCGWEFLKTERAQFYCSSDCRQEHAQRIVAEARASELTERQCRHCRATFQPRNQRDHWCNGLCAMQSKWNDKRPGSFPPAEEI